MPPPRRTPRPGSPVRGSRTGRPIMALLDLLGRRWALRVLWELREGPRNFRALVVACDDMSTSTLNARLAELRDAQILAQTDDGYVVTDEGRGLLEHLASLDAWAKAWASRLARASRRSGKGERR